MNGREPVGFGRFDFGLNSHEEARAERLLKDSIVVDALFQGPTTARGFTPALLEHLEVRPTDGPWQRFRRSRDLPARQALRGSYDDFRRTWEESGITLGNRQVELAPAFREADFALAQAQFDRLEWLEKALAADDVVRAKADGKRAGIISTQNSDGLDVGLDLLDAAYEFGMRMIGLTYNTQNLVGCGSTERIDSGLSTFGVTLVRRMDELGIIVDTAHSGRETTLDACRTSERAVVASHTSAKSVFHHQRAKSDEEIEAIASTGGVLGVYAVPFFLTSAGHGSIDLVLDHIDYISRLVGWQHVALGTDWPMSIEAEGLELTIPQFTREMGFREEHNIGVWNLDGFGDYRDFPNFPRGMVARGYTDEQIGGILGGNFMRVFREVCG